MLTDAGAKVLDFGISALVGERDGAPDGSLLGTPAYLAPERLRGGPVSAATDVYALGVLLYRSLTGRLPWRAETTTDILKAHLHAAPAPLPDLPGLPPEVVELCLSCLAKQPGDRPSSVDVARRLAAAAGTTPILPVAADVGDARTTMLPWSAAEQAGTGSVRRAVRGAGRRPAGGGPGRAGGRVVAVGRRAMPPAAGEPAVPDAGPAASGPALPAAAGPAGVDRAASAVGGPAGSAVAPAAAAGGRAPIAGGSSASARPAVSGPPVRGAGNTPARHRRIRAAAVAVGLLAAGGLTWGAWTFQEGADPVQAAAAPGGLGSLGGADVPCRIAYDVTDQSATGFGARLAVTNGGDRALHGWKLRFSLTGDQQVLAGDGYLVAQSGRQVVIRPVGTSALQPDATAQLRVQGSYRATNPVPAGFTLDGHSCTVQPASPETTTLADQAGGPGAVPVAGGATGSGGVAAGGAADPASGATVDGGSGSASGGAGSPGAGVGPGSGPVGGGNTGGGSTGGGGTGGSTGGGSTGGGSTGGGNPGGGDSGGGNPGGGDSGGGNPGGGDSGGGDSDGGDSGGGNPGGGGSGGDKPDKDKDKGEKPEKDKDKDGKGKGDKPEKDKGDKAEKDKGDKAEKDKGDKDRGEKGKGGGKSGAGAVPDLPTPSLPVVPEPV
jgi:serine/threonine-protein kinase